MIQRRFLAGNLGKFCAWLLINSCFKRARKSRLFTDYMYKPRTSGSSRCNSPSTAPHIRSPGHRPHTHTPSSPHSAHSTYTSICLTALTLAHLGLNGSQRAEICCACMPCTNHFMLVLSQHHRAHPGRGVYTLTVLCILVPTFLHIFACSTSHHLKCLCSRVFFSMCSSPFLFFFPLTSKLF